MINADSLLSDLKKKAQAHTQQKLREAGIDPDTIDEPTMDIICGDVANGAAIALHLMSDIFEKANQPTNAAIVRGVAQEARRLFL